MRLALKLWLVAALAAPLGAQERPSPTFDVASVKPNKSGEARARFSVPPGRLAITNAPLRDIIRTAYQTSDFQVVGLPTWAASERFDIEASTRSAQTSPGRPLILGPGGPPLDVLLMLRALLAERFQLRVHTEMRELPAYALVLARRDKRLGAELAPSTIDCEALAAAALANPNAPPKPPRPGQPPKCGMFGVPGRLEGWSATLTELAQMLTPLMDRVVINETSLPGGFDLKVTFTPPLLPQDPAPPATAQPLDASGPSLTTALEEQLGLKLNPTRRSLQVLAIDAVSRPLPD
jgi:uncharacterized protein (TIGR03435 family)